MEILSDEEADDYKQNSDELNGKFVGDMILKPDQLEGIHDDRQADSFQNGRADKKYRWKRRKIAYTVPRSFSAQQKSILRKALSILESASGCLLFVKRTNQIDYIQVEVKEILNFSDYIYKFNF